MPLKKFSDSKLIPLFQWPKLGQCPKIGNKIKYNTTPEVEYVLNGS